ncbi:MAG: hypothetical protein ABJ239_00420 [Erythrobacter sp.]
MPNIKSLVGAALAASLLVGCATTAAPGPVEVTRFHNANAIGQVGQGTVFVETAAGEEGNSLELAAYKLEVLNELVKLGYREAARADADHIAQVSLDRYSIKPETKGRGPVSVGVGGSTGGYGSGVGLGIGLNLGGGGQKERVGTDISVRLRNATDNASLWEGRASLSVGRDSPLAAPAANADIIADALFRDFPGNDGETIEIEVNE